MSNTMSREVLVLNKGWTAVGFVSLERAIVMLFSAYKDGTPKARIIDPTRDFQQFTWADWSRIKPREGENIIRTANDNFAIPEVILLTRYDKLPMQKANFSRRTLFRRDSNTCFVDNTLILMSDFSLKPISEINVNDTIIDAYGNSQIVEHVHCREAVDGEIVSVKHRGNGDALISTIDHKFLPFSWNGELLNSEGVAISDLGLDSYLSEIIPKCPLESASIDLYKLSLAHLPYVKLIGNKVKHYCGNLVTQYIPLDNKLGRLCGYYLSEGSVTNGCVSFGLHGQTEIVYANEICMLLKDIFGLDSKWEVDGNQGKVICNSTVLALFFSKFFGTKEEKHVGLKPNRAFLEGIMYGVCRGDATFNNDQARCTLMMSRPNLIRDLYVVSLMLGFCPSLSKTGIRSDGRIYKSVNFNAADYNTIAKLANVPYVEWQPSKFSKVDRKLVDNHLISKITEIKQLNYKGLVYDLQVGGSHTYIANFVCVHNCQYCGTRPGSEELTLDHIMPRSRGGKTTWENVVCACVSCNSKKADRTPAEAGMKLRTKPVKPTLSICRRQAIKCESWKHFISEVYWATTLDNDMNE